MKIEEVLDREIPLIGYRVRESKYAKRNSPVFMTLQFEIDSKRRILFTGSTVLADQIERYKDEIPFLATIVKIDKYYSLS